MKGKHAKATGRTHTAAKRVLALIFATALLCSCLLSVFASNPSLVDTIKDATSTLDASSTADDTDSASSGYMSDFAAYYDSIASKTTYRFWLQETDELAEVNNGTRALSDCEDFYKKVEYRDGKTLEEPSDFGTPTDPTGAGRTFEGWYSYDASGEKQTFEFNGFVLTIVEDSTVDVFAKWKELPEEEDASSDEDKNEETDAKTDEQKTDDKTTDSGSKSTGSNKGGTTGTNLEKAIQDQDGNTYTVMVEGLPETAKTLGTSVSADIDEAFADTVTNNKLSVLMQFNITPQDADGNTVQPEDGKSATVSIGSFSIKDDTSVKVLHLKDGKVETLEGTVSGGMLTFETTSFSAFVVAMSAESSTESSEIEAQNAAVCLYIKVVGDTTGLELNDNNWYTIGRIYVKDLDYGFTARNAGVTYQKHYTTGERWNMVMEAIRNSANVERYQYNQAVVLENLHWDNTNRVNGDTQEYGLIIENGADHYYNSDEAAWHLDGFVNGSELANYTVKYIDIDTKQEIKNTESAKEIGTVASRVYAWEYSDTNPTIEYGGTTYQYICAKEDSIVLRKNQENVLTLYYKAASSGFAIEKKVEGNMGDLTKDYEFTVTIMKADGTSANEYSITKGTDTSTIFVNNGVATFTLQNEQRVLLSNVPIGATVTITETNMDSSYTVEASLDRGKNKTKSSNNSFTFTFGSGSENVIAKNGTVTIINTLEVSPPTGVLLDTLPYLLMLAAVGVGMVVLVVRRRNRPLRHG